MSSWARSRDGLRVGVGRRVPHDDLRVLLERSHRARPSGLSAECCTASSVLHVAEQDASRRCTSARSPAGSRSPARRRGSRSSRRCRRRRSPSSSPVTVFLSVSTLGFGPSSWYSPPCSASGFQSVCTIDGAGQTPASDVASPPLRPCRRCAAAGGGRPAPGRRRAPACRRRRRVAVIPARGEEQEAGQRNREPGCLGGLAHVPSL